MKKVFFMKTEKVIVFSMLFFSFTTSAIAQETKKDYSIITTTQDTAWWKFENGLLIITGKGEIPDYDNMIRTARPLTPWRSYRLLITSVNIEDGITKIGNAAFSGCKNLTSINIPESVESIGANAFYGCENLTSVIIPDKISSLETGVFARCKKLAVVEVKNPVPPKNEVVTFFQVPVKNAKLIVPAGTKITYAETEVWKNFGIIEER